MNITRCMCVRRNLNPSKALISYINNGNKCLVKYASTKTSEITEPLKAPQEKEVFHVAPRVQNRKTAFKPIIKNIFLGTCQNDTLEFLEVLDNDDIYALDKRIEAINNLITDEKQTKDEIYSNLKKWRIVGAPATVFHGGLEANMSERLRILESLSHNVDVAKHIRDHWMGMYCLVDENIPENERNELIPGFTDGSVKIRVCINEKHSTSPDQPDLRTEASYNGVGGWTITGEKLIEKMDVDQDTYMVVICAENRMQNLQSFLVEPGAAGVNFEKNCVLFNDTPARLLGDEDTLDTTGANSKSTMVIQNILINFRMDTAAIYLGSLGKIITDMVSHIKGTYASGKPHSSVPYIQDALTSANLSHYRAASALYMTAGLADGLISQDIELEAAACRDLCIRAYTDSLNDIYDALNVNLGVQRTLDLENMLGEGSCPLRVYLGLVGLRHAGHEMAIEVKKLRNPLMYPMFAMKKAISSGQPTLSLRLKDNLHHSLSDAANLLETCILKMNLATETVLMRHGNDILLAHRNVNRLAMAVTEIYAMFAVLSRASRSYCIGLRNADKDIGMAIRICYVGHARVMGLISCLDEGAEMSWNLASESMAKESVKRGGNISEHSLKRSFS